MNGLLSRTRCIMDTGRRPRDADHYVHGPKVVGESYAAKGRAPRADRSPELSLVCLGAPTDTTELFELAI